jgi:hypothetical protein
MDNYQTPIQMKKTRILGMTIPQLGLLAGLILVQLVILVVALKYFVFAPDDNLPPPVTPIAVAPMLEPTLAPTPVLDLSSAVLTIDDLPAGFISAEDDSSNLDFSEQFPDADFHPVNKFTLLELQKGQFVVGWAFAFKTTAERENFDILITHPNEMFYTNDKFEENVKTLEGLQLGKSNPIGELSSGWTVTVAGDANVDRADIVLFSYKNYGGIVEVLYKSDQTPVISAWDAAQKLDRRILDVMVNGPIPTPVVIAFNDLAGVKLNQEELPAGFQPVPEAELNLDETSRSEIETGGMRVAGVFGFTNDKPNAQEYVLGFTFLFSDTVGKAVMDQMLAGEEFLNAMFEPTPTQKRQPLTINKPIGDRALSTAIMEITDTGGVRCDVLVFRRGHVGVALFYIYLPGRRQTTVEDLAVKLDAKIQALASP